MTTTATGLRPGGGWKIPQPALRGGSRETSVRRLYRLSSAIANFAAPLGFTIARHTVQWYSLGVAAVAVVALSTVHALLSARGQRTRLIGEALSTVVALGVVETVAFDGVDFPIVLLTTVVIVAGLALDVYGDVTVSRPNLARVGAGRTAVIFRVCLWSGPGVAVARLPIRRIRSPWRVTNRPRGPCGPGSLLLGAGESTDDPSRTTCWHGVRRCAPWAPWHSHDVSSWWPASRRPGSSVRPG